MSAKQFEHVFVTRAAGRVSKCTLCMLLDLCKFSYLELKHVKDLTRNLSEHLSLNPNIEYAFGDCKPLWTAPKPSTTPTTRQELLFEKPVDVHWTSLTAWALQMPKSMVQEPI
jgi:hypothetical protein